MDRIEYIIIKNLIYNDKYCSKTIPFIKEDYFQVSAEKLIVNQIIEFIDKYKSLPTYEALIIEISNLKYKSQSDIEQSIEILNIVKKDRNNETDFDWIMNRTEKFCQDRALYNAIMDSVNIIEGEDKARGKGEIPKLLSDALGVTFDNNVGHDYIDDAESRYDFYTRVEEKLPFDIYFLNKITNGGLSNKTLNIILAGTGVGKSLCMCHMAAAAVSAGHDVLYITMEMSEEKIAERIDANLLDVNIQELGKISKNAFTEKIDRLKAKAHGKLIIKEYPTASASVYHFRALLDDLKLKKKFKPQIIFIDYLNICMSSRLKHGSNVNSYAYIKAIAEEIRGLAVEMNVPIVSATQTTRSGYTSSDPGLEDTSESFGLPATADLMFAVITNEELEKLNQFLVKQLKNRYNDPNFYRRFVIGVDKPKMRLYDLEQSAQKEVSGVGITDEEKEIEDLYIKRNSKFNFDGVKVE